MKNTKKTKPTIRKQKTKVSKPVVKKVMDIPIINWVNFTRDGIITKDKHTLIDFIATFKKENGIIADDFLNISCSKCDKRHIFKSPEDIPSEHLNCICGGNVITYTGEVVNSKD